MPGLLRCCCGLSLLLWSTANPAAVRIDMEIPQVDAEGWSAQGIRIAVESGRAGHDDWSVVVDRVELPRPHGRLSGLVLRCLSERDEAGDRHCREGRLEAEGTPVGKQTTTWTGTLTAAGALTVAVPALRLGRGRAAVDVRYGGGDWHLQVALKRVAAQTITRVAQAAWPPVAWGLKGALSGRVEASGADGEPGTLDARLVLGGLTFNATDGTQAAEQLEARFDVDARRRNGTWRFNSRLRLPRGQLYVDPVFVDFDAFPTEFALAGSWQPNTTRLNVDSFSAGLGKAASLNAAGRLRTSDLSAEDLTIALRSDDAAGLYDVMLQPFLIGSPVDDLEIQGRVGLALHADNAGVSQVGLELGNLTLRDRQERFSVDRLRGTVGWARSEAGSASRIGVAGAEILRVPIGAFDVQARFAGDRVVLLQPIVVPLLGGDIALDSFALEGALVAGRLPSWRASASMRDVSLGELTRVLDWPPFDGSVAGQLRDMQYADQTFRIGGGLSLDAFDGRMRVDNLVIREPLGSVPVLEAEASFEGLSLEELTKTFSFGRIDGRLDGVVDGISLVAWEPDHFDLHFFTPAGDRSRRRISQRAVENLTELGNGGTAALSATILRFFEEFRYEAIDLKVGLRGETATLDGLARPDGGYYLVKGAGLPRIDVIGRNRRVAWKDLVERLRRIQVQGATIE